MHFAIDISGMERDKVDSFVIVAPGEWPDAGLRELETYLKGRFPELEFFANGGHENDYLVVPMRGVAVDGPDGDGSDGLRMLDPPDPSVMFGIEAALKSFRPGRPPALN